MEAFLHNPVYVSITSRTIQAAENAYRTARILSIVSFLVGICLLIFAVYLTFRDNQLLSVVFGGLGALNTLTLILYKPIERIQEGIDRLIISQIACVSFATQHDIILRSSSSSGQLDYKALLEMAAYMRETTGQIISDLARNRSQAPKSARRDEQQ